MRATVSAAELERGCTVCAIFSAWIRKSLLVASLRAVRIAERTTPDILRI